jgi:hypothetical protein
VPPGCADHLELPEYYSEKGIPATDLVLVVTGKGKGKRKGKRRGKGEKREGEGKKVSVRGLRPCSARNLVDMFKFTFWSRSS